MKRLGLFGGTFDPPHVGHLALAEWARERLHLDQVVFVPAGQPPHKRTARLSSARHRLAMTRLATRDNRAFVVSTVELGAAGPSYTIETLRRLQRAQRAERWFLLIGMDSLDEFSTWHEPEAILELATLAVAERPHPGPAARRRAPRRGVVWLGNPGLDVSSTLVRARARSGRSVRYLVPDGVAGYIARHRLYRGPRAARP